MIEAGRLCLPAMGVRTNSGVAGQGRRVSDSRMAGREGATDSTDSARDARLTIASQTTQFAAQSWVAPFACARSRPLEMQEADEIRRLLGI